MNSLVLITIPPSHYCEKARWALDLAGFKYDEQKWPPGLHVFGTRTANTAGTTSVPILILPSGKALTDSSDILSFVHAEHPELCLYPADPDQLAAVRAWEDKFNKVLGVATRLAAYQYLFTDPPLTRQVLLDQPGMKSWKKTTFYWMSPLMFAAMKQGMGINAANADKALKKVEAIFKEVEDSLSDGRRYLMGDSFSAADLTFAALAAPLLMPAEFGAKMPPLEQFPKNYPAHGLRQTVSGQFALRMFSLHRSPRNSRM